MTFFFFPQAELKPAYIMSFFHTSHMWGGMFQITLQIHSNEFGFRSECIEPCSASVRMQEILHKNCSKNRSYFHL